MATVQLAIKRVRTVISLVPARTVRRIPVPPDLSRYTDIYTDIY